MKKRTNCFNPKRKIASPEEYPENSREKLVSNVKYGGNPEHKKSPSDYGLTPPSSPRPGKTLCDGVNTISKKDAETYLKSGFQKGMLSVRKESNWPQNVWAVSPKGEVYEAQLENKDLGTYHGYPMPVDDDFRREVIAEWKKR